jgi:aspartokinase/homoserine dehydrogenase 1
MMTCIHKLGGTSVGSAERISAGAALIAAAARDTQTVVVSSAMAGVTNRLIACAELAARHDAGTAVADAKAMAAEHQAALEQLGGTSHPLQTDIDAIATEVISLVRAIGFLGEVPPRIHDRIVAAGEKMAVRLVSAALRACGVDAEPADADTFLETDDRFGAASPLGEVAERRIRDALEPVLASGAIAVVTGFCGRSPDGSTTTLGRGGSDFSATIIGAAMNADEVIIWTDVDGVFTADPSVVSRARVIPQLSYREAAELSHYGAKVLYQRTMIPVAQRGIPVHIRNSLRPDAAGTTVDGRFTPGSHPVKGISAIRAQCLVSVEGKGMAGIPGVAARVFRSLAERNVNVTMISQSSSESSICLAVASSDQDNAESALKRALRQELSLGAIEEVLLRSKVALVAAVGLGMAHSPGIAGRVFRALGSRGINVLAIAQGSSELNISLAVDEEDAAPAIRAMHEEFGLHGIDTGEDLADALDMALLGCGKVGRAVAELVLSRHDYIRERFGLIPRLIALSDRSGYVFRPAGIPTDEAQSLLQDKARGASLATHACSVSGGSMADLVADASRWRLVRPLLVDTTDSSESYDAIDAALNLGWDVVTANKNPLAGSLTSFQALLAHERLIKAEATVGAGLPVLDTLANLLAAGDELFQIDGVLSGTLAFLLHRIEQGSSFSEAMQEAMAQGLTEPDPRVDLSGRDVARKGLIIGRMAGLITREIDIVCEPFLQLPEPTDGDLIATLRHLDGVVEGELAAARDRGEALRYVARVEPNRVVAQLAPVPLDSPLGRLRGTDNLISIRSQRYHDRPLVVSGPGAGVHVTALGVLSDIMRIAAERRPS